MLSGPNTSARKPTRPSLGKEASALFYWLVLRTPLYCCFIAGKN